MADNDLDVAFQTQRSALIKRYLKADQPFKAATKPYKSTLQLIGTGTLYTNDVDFLVFKAGQVLEFFSYKLGDSIPYGAPGLTRRAIEDDCTQSKGRQTNGIEDFVIEGISMTCRSKRIQLQPVTLNPALNTFDKDIQNSVNGLISVADPASLLFNPQVDSPFNLQDTLFEAIKPHLAIEFEWDRRYVEKIGTSDQIPEGGAKSFLKASGDPRNDNRYRIPEGYLWCREGDPDSEFIVRATLVDPVFIPLNNLRVFNATPVNENAHTAYIFLDISMRLHGLSLSVPTRN